MWWLLVRWGRKIKLWTSWVWQAMLASIKQQLNGTPSLRAEKPVDSLQQCARNPSIDISSRSTTCSETPWHALLWNPHVHRTECDAVVISNSWVLTSARCVHYYAHRPRDLVISLGVNAASNKTKSTRAKSVVLYPRWQSKSRDIRSHDIALVEMKRQLKYGRESCPVKPICLPSPGEAPAPKHLFCFGTETNTAKKTVKTIFETTSSCKQ